MFTVEAENTGLDLPCALEALDKMGRSVTNFKGP